MHLGCVCCALARHIASKNYLSPTQGTECDWRRGWARWNWGNYWRRWPEAWQLPLDVGAAWLLGSLAPSTSSCPLSALSYQRHINKYAGRTKGHVQTGFAYPNPLPRPLCHAHLRQISHSLISFFVRVCLICLRSLVFAAALQLIFQDNGPRGGVEK